MLQLTLTPTRRLTVLALLLLPVLSCARQATTRAQSQPWSQLQNSSQSTSQSPPQSQSPSLEQLRADLAMRFMEPAPHMALARYFRDRGDRLQAFYILETARRGRFEEGEFNRAFAAAFGQEPPVDASREAEAARLREFARDPNSVEAIARVADIYIARQDWAKAKEYIAKAIRVEPAGFENADAMAEVLRREGDQAGAERVISDYTRNHPDTVDGYRLRIAELSQNDPARARLLLTEAIAKYPRAGGFAFDMGAALQREGKLREAEEHFVKAAALSPDSAYIQAWVGRFFFKVKNDNRRALDYYLSAYLLDPHAYESEFVESRITKINDALAAAEFARKFKSGVPLAQITQDPNPMVVLYALENMTEQWKPAYLPTVLALLGHDEGSVRWQATEAIKRNDDRSFDETLRALLRDTDLRRRGLALYIAAHLWGRESLPTLRATLREPSQLLRFDAVSSLLIDGGAEGRELIVEHLPRESNLRLKKMIQTGLREEHGQRQ